MNPRYDKALSIGASRILRIFFEILVLLHHLRPTSSPLDAEINSVLGPIAVGGFLMISGYGVGVRLRENGADYAKRLLMRRAPIAYCRILLTDLLYLIPFFLIGEHFSNASSVVESILYLPFLPDFVALSRWVYFIADLLVYYLVIGAFALLFYERKHGKLMTLLAYLLSLLILVAVLSVINARTGSSRYMRGAFLFPIGYAIATWEEGILSSKRITSLMKWAVFVLMIGIGIGVFFADAAPIREYLLPIPFALAEMVALIGCDPKGKVLAYFSDLVIGVYLSHEAFLTLFRHFLPDLDRWLTMLFVVLCAFATAALIDAIKRAIRYYRKKNAPPQLPAPATEERDTK